MSHKQGFASSISISKEVSSSVHSFADFALESFFSFFFSQFFLAARWFSSISSFLNGSISSSLSDIIELVFVVSFCSVHLLNDLHSFCFISELFRTFECQKRSKDTPSFMFYAQRSDEKTNV